MERRFFIFALVLLLIIGAAAVSGCSADGNQNSHGNQPPNNSGSPTPQEPEPSKPGAPYPDKPSLGGIYLGMSVEELDKIVKAEYSEEFVEEGGYFGENIIYRHYTNGCDLVIDEESGEVLQVDVYSAEYPTNLGVKVGHHSMQVINNYREDYEEWVGNQSPEKLAGWFLVEPETLLIFSSQENRERYNGNLTEDSKIYGITLGRPQYFD
jgi:hypothetical protein